jgi:hypothetical protein
MPALFSMESKEKRAVGPSFCTVEGSTAAMPLRPEAEVDDFDQDKNGVRGVQKFSSMSVLNQEVV